MWNLKKLKTKKKTNLIDTVNTLMVARGGRWGMGEMEERGQKIKTPSYKICKSWKYTAW